MIFWTRLFAICFMSTVWVSAQSDPMTVFQHPLAGENPTFLAVTAQMRATPVLRAQFSQAKQIKALRRPLLSSGDFLFAADAGVWWNTLKPFHTTFVITSKGLRQESEDGTVKIIEASEQPIISGFTKVFMSLFGGDTSALNERFKLFFEGDAQNWRVGLQPRSKVMGKLIQSIVIEGGEHMTQIHFLESTGDLTRISFSGVQVSPATLSDQERRRFVF